MARWLSAVARSIARTASATTRRARANLPFNGPFQGPFQRPFEAGRHHRRLAGWMPSRASINQMLAADGPILLARSRDLSRNNPYVASAKESFVANLVGTGIKPSPLVDDPALKDAMQQAWLAWTDEADADGITDYYGLQALVAGALFEAGECFIRFRERTMEDGLTVPLQLQVLESEMCPVEMNQVGPSGNDIINGIEFDADASGKRVAYWFWTVFPGDPRFRRDPEMRVRVPADEVMHIFRPLRPGQVRGQPWITPSIIKFWLLDSYDDAELDRKRTAAMYTGFITSPTPEDFKGEVGPDGDGYGGGAENGVGGAVLEPGTMQMLLPGEDVKFSDPTEVGGSYEAFQYRNLTAAGAGAGTPYSAMTGDQSKANYSSDRAGKIESRRRLEQLQHGVLAFQLCRPVWRRWTTLAVICGAYDAPGFALRPQKYQAVKWIAPRFEWVDPLKDLQAEDLAVNAGFKARSSVIESMGEDPEETDRRIAADQKRAKAYNLNFSARPAPIQVPAADEQPDGDKPDTKPLSGSDEA